MDQQLQLLLDYLQAHPLVAVGLIVLAVLLFGSLLRRLIRLALFFVLILLGALYWTHREAEADWQEQAHELVRRAAELGEEARDRGRQLLDEGKRKLEQERDESDAK